MSISGDFPIFAVRIGDVADLEIVAQALRYQEYMRARGLVADLVIVNEQASSYVQDLQQAIEQLCENSRLRGKELGPRQHIFAVRRDLMDENSYRTLLAVARVVLHTRNGRIFDQIERAEAAALAARDAAQACRRRDGRDRRAGRSPAPPPAARDRCCRRRRAGCASWNGFGGFDRGGRDYVVRLGRPAARTPHPWINVISNTAFGFHTSAEGASFTWSRNSRDFQLTPWTNDPVTNRPGEAFYVHRPGQRQDLLAVRGRRARRVHDLRGASRPGFLHLHGQTRPADAGTDATRRSCRPGEAVAADDPQFRIGRGKAQDLCLCRMGARQQPREIGADHRAGAGRQRPARSSPAIPTASTSATASPSSRATALPSR